MIGEGLVGVVGERDRWCRSSDPLCLAGLATALFRGSRGSVVAPQAGLGMTLSRLNELIALNQ